MRRLTSKAQRQQSRWKAGPAARTLGCQVGLDLCGWVAKETTSLAVALDECLASSDPWFLLLLGKHKLSSAGLCGRGAVHGVQHQPEYLDDLFSLFLSLAY